jgi:uncharacterized protein
VRCIASIFAGSILLVATAVAAHAPQQIPSVPKYYVLDEPRLLAPQQEKALESILIEHDAATGQQIMVAVFKSLKDADATARTTDIFNTWAVGKRGQDNGALLALYADDREARIQAGYGLEQLNDAQIRKVLRDFLMPELKAGRPYRALGLSVLEVLRTIESPLIESGRAQSLLRAGGLEGDLRPAARGPGAGGWFFFVLIGAVLLVFVVAFVLSADAHFTSGGWFRPNAWKQVTDSIRKPTLKLGGADGSW